MQGKELTGIVNFICAMFSSTFYRDVTAADMQLVIDVTGCSVERARRALEQHSVEFAINCIFDEPSQEPARIQKTSHPSPSAPASSPLSALKPAHVSSVNQGTMAKLSQSPAHAYGGGAAMLIAGLQPCDRSKITLISTTEPQEGGFGELRNLGLLAADCMILIFCH
jgi:hypothetical protein